MSEAFIVRRGGGSGGLNFRVVGGTSAPNNPKENDIWVDTSNNITGWVFASENPYAVTVPCENSVDGLYFTADGGQGTNSSLSITAYAEIPVGTQKITIKNSATTTVTCYHVFYAADKSMVSAVARQNGTAEYNVPANASYVRLSVVDGDPFSFTVITSVEEGFVWIQTSTESTTPFNALKKNGIEVYPISAKQYSGGAWIDKTVKMYIGGVWVDWWTWDGELYIRGDEYEDITGGWAIADVPPGGWNYTNAATLTKNADNMVAVGKLNTLYTNNKIDVTNYNTLVVKGTTSHWGTFGVKPTRSSTEDGTSGSWTNGDTVGRLDISKVTGEHYVHFCLGNNNNHTLTLTEIYLE